MSFLLSHMKYFIFIQVENQSQCLLALKSIKLIDPRWRDWRCRTLLLLLFFSSPLWQFFTFEDKIWGDSFTLEGGKVSETPPSLNKSYHIPEHNNA